MGKINRIQLRGISRTPSDRLNSDGGVAESLNIYIDEAESAPALLPVDVTSELGLPEDLVADRVFVHKMSSLENAIAISDEVAAWVEGEKQVVCELSESEEVTDIASIGNTVIVTTSARPIYILFKEGKYNLLGESIPMPTIEFFDQETPIAEPGEMEKGEGGTLSYNPTVKMTYSETLTGSIPRAKALAAISYAPSSDEEKDTLDYLVKYDMLTPYWGRMREDGKNEVESARKIVEDLRTLYYSVLSENSEKGVLSRPVWAIFGLRLYDGSLKMSVPYMLSGGVDAPVDVYAIGFENIGFSHSYYYLRLNHYYRIGIRMRDWHEEADAWNDIIKGVEVYISQDIDPLDWKSMTVEKRTKDNDAGITYAKMKVSGSKGDYMAFATSCTSFVNVASFAIDESYYSPDTPSISEIREDYIIDMSGRIQEEDRFGGTLLSSERYSMDASSYVGKTDNYNNRCILSDITRFLGTGARALLSQRYNPYLPIPRSDINEDAVAYPSWWEWTLPESDEIPIAHYQFTYYIDDNQGNEAVVYGRSDEGRRDFSMDYTRNPSGTKPLAFFLAIYPDRNCRRVDVTAEGKSKTYTMSEHPYLPNCSIAYGPEMHGDMENAVEKEIPQEQKRLSLANKIGVTMMDNPFLLDSAGFYAFQSRVLGVAVATTSLSQGQFGQFPLYVFTEDGIWAMETAADGSFVTSKPLSRDVCINPDSITSIDNAVVFVTDKGVMLLQGSQVVNISPHMNGKHYTIEESAKVIVNGQEGFKDLIPVVSEDTHFMAFVKEASIAYDYSGKRLIFIKKDEAYQYIYRLDTNTWHKTAYGIEVNAPLNSYPDCYVMTAGQAEKRYMYVKSVTGSPNISSVAAVIFTYFPLYPANAVTDFLDQKTEITITGMSLANKVEMQERLLALGVATGIRTEAIKTTRIYNLSTPLDVESQQPMKGVIITRPFDLDLPDELKSITDLRIRGQYTRGAVKYILLGSMDGHNFHVINTKRGKSWKLFRLIILADLKPTERISWVDVEFEQRFNNRLR